MAKTDNLEITQVPRMKTHALGCPK